MPTLQEWLEDPSAVRGIFVIATRYNVNTTAEESIYLSSVGYLLSDSSISFEPIVASGIKFVERLSINGEASLSYGDVEINNPNGELDSWLEHTSYVWVNRSIKIYIGDPKWVVADLTAFLSTFHLVFDGVIADIDSKNRELLNIRLVDKLQRLNTSVTEDTLGAYGTWIGGSPNEDELKPLIFGEVHNITPISTDPAKLEYMVNNGLTEQIIEIRDNGVPIYTSADTGIVGAVAITDSATINISNASPDLNTTPALGSFRLKQPAAGTVTVSVQGMKRSMNLTTGAVQENTYSNNIAKLIALIVTEYGNATYNLDGATELDLTNFAAFSANIQPVGIYLPSRENVINVIQQLARSIGAQVFMTRYGKLQLLRIGVSTTNPVDTVITDSDILQHSLGVSERTEVVSAVKLNTVKNWTVQEGIVTGIPEEHKVMFAEDYKKSSSDSATHAAVKSMYRLTAEPEASDSYLLKKADGDTEADRLVTYFKTPRTIYRFTGISKLLSLTLGQGVTIIHNRFGLYNSGAGKIGQVVSFSPDWLNATVDIEVIV